jgi:hypothetical protein
MKMKFLKLMTFIMCICLLSACEKQADESGDCYAAGCRLQGENFYLVEDAELFAGMDLCREKIEAETQEYGIRILYEDGAQSSDLYTTGGVDKERTHFKLICEKRYYEPGFIYYFSKEGTSNPN